MWGWSSDGADAVFRPPPPPVVETMISTAMSTTTAATPPKRTARGHPRTTVHGRPASPRTVPRTSRPPVTSAGTESSGRAEPRATQRPAPGVYDMASAVGVKRCRIDRRHRWGGWRRVGCGRDAIVDGLVGGEHRATTEPRRVRLLGRGRQRVRRRSLVERRVRPARRRHDRLRIGRLGRRPVGQRSIGQITQCLARLGDRPPLLGVLLQQAHQHRREHTGPGRRRGLVFDDGTHRLERITPVERRSALGRRVERDAQ